MKTLIELPVLVLFFAFIFSGSIKTNLIIYRTCYVTLGYNQSECALLGTNQVNNQTAQLEKMIEPYAAVINMVDSLPEAAFTALICLFIGPWSDKFGRKPFLVIPLIGYTLSYFLLVGFALLENISPWYSLVSVIPVYLTGGLSSYLTVLLCYVSDITDERNRGMKMGFFEATIALGIFLGNITSSYAFEAMNYEMIFLISALCCLFTFLFTIFCIPESISNPETEKRFSQIFMLDNIRDMLKTTFKKREKYDRFIVLSCIVFLGIFILVINGDGALTFLYVRDKFNWPLQQYVLFNAAHNIAWVVGTLLGTYILHKLLKIPETIMICVGFASMFCGMLMMGLAKYNWQVYMASFARSLGGVLSPMVRSLVSKIVPNEEIGKVFSVIVISESFIGMAGSPLFTAIYNTTITTNPAIFNFVEAGIYLMEMGLALIIVFLTTSNRSAPSYTEIVNETENSEERVQI